MKNITTILVLFIMISFTFIACEKPKPLLLKKYECEFVQDDNTTDGMIDDDEKVKISECIDNQYDNMNDIMNNLKGEWELVGHGEGWFQAISQPCGYAIFGESDGSFQYQDGQVDTTYNFSWEVAEINGRFGLKLSPYTPFPLKINTFSENYMFFSHIDFDGNMYLYEKVK